MTTIDQLTPKRKAKTIVIRGETVAAYQLLFHGTELLVRCLNAFYPYLQSDNRIGLLTDQLPLSLELVAASFEKDYDWIEQSSAEDVLEMIDAAIEVNARFFIQAASLRMGRGGLAER